MKCRRRTTKKNKRRKRKNYKYFNQWRNKKVYKEYVIKNIPILEEYCGYKYKEIIYNSFEDGELNETFGSEIMVDSHLVLFSVIVLFS